ncbi:MAG TPA: hypothetical protein VFQ53_34850 [Kofleriaceae bacterium]|nr:hypothetical protein [Kofleriaceae bacterium]
MRWIAFVVALSACGRFGFGSEPDPDAIAAMGDGSPDAPPLGPFTSITLVPGINDPAAQDDDPSLTADMLEIYFDSERAAAGGGNGDIWFASRTTITEPFSAPVLVSELTSPGDDTTPDVSPDGLTIYFGSDRASAGNRDLYVSTRATRSSAWGAPQRITELASPSDDSGAMETEDGLHLVLASARAGTMDLYVATRTARDQPWGPPAPIPALASATASEDQHWIDATASVIYLAADLPGSVDADIWMATRRGGLTDYNAPVRLDELSSNVADVDPWLSPDQRTMFFMSKRSGVGDIYMATR